MSVAFEQSGFFALSEVEEETEGELDTPDNSHNILKSAALATGKPLQANRKWGKRFTKVKAAIVSVFLPSQKLRNQEECTDSGKKYAEKNQLLHSKTSFLQCKNEEGLHAEFLVQSNSISIPRPQNFPVRKLLPSQKERNLPTLVLDLDETLTHSILEDDISAENADFKFKVFWNWEKVDVKVRFRPYLREFLEQMSEKFEIVVFTASLAQFASPVMDAIDPKGSFISHRLYRESCTYFAGVFIKDLSSLNRKLETTTIVDNSPNSYMWHTENAIPIKSWYSEDTDTELIRVMHHLNKRFF